MRVSFAINESIFFITARCSDSSVDVYRSYKVVTFKGIINANAPGFAIGLDAPGLYVAGSIDQAGSDALAIIISLHLPAA